MNRIRFYAPVVALVSAPLVGQNFVDLTEVRFAPRPYWSVLEIEAGMIGTMADDKESTLGLDNDLSWDGHIYYRDGGGAAGRGNQLEAYAGRDGVLLSLADGELIGDDTTSKLELRARPWMFYRDGYYAGDSFVGEGLYEGSDYEAYAGFGRLAQGALYVEMGPYYRWNRFSRSDLTRPDFAVPDDYNAYGGRLYVEQANVEMDRRLGVPMEGFVITLGGEREWNDSDGQIGRAGFSSSLPNAVWRAKGRLEWYVPTSDELVWEIFALGGWQDELDRVRNTEGQKPLGHIWGDAQIRLRLQFSDTFTLTPFAHGQYSQLDSDEPGASNDKFFFGGGVESYLHVSDSIALHAFYSYLDNESRPSIRIDEDLHGEHMFYIGLVTRFGASRR
ncbi:MAG: hypothetical protein RL398_3106 [Planctomycetota bacterium]|jgi:hypothetical protein